jgi:hypothetical protein
MILAAVLAAAVWIWQRPQDAGAGIPPMTFGNAATSADALVERFLVALAAGDRNAIESLRVDENEYRRLIMPGSVKPGQKPQLMPDKKSEYFWRDANTKSVYTLAGIVADYGGKSYRLKTIERGRTERFAWYTAHRDPILHLEAEDGRPVRLQLGSIAELNGGFKFISYYSD